VTTTPAPATQTYHLFIRATPQQIWDALTQPEHSARTCSARSSRPPATVGYAVSVPLPDRTALWGDDTVLDADPPHRLVVSYRGLYNPDLATEPASRVTWQIEPDQDGVCLLTVVHDHSTTPNTAARVAGPGWMRVLSGLKTHLETGTALNA